ncbi:mitogen-activated protein kinase 15 [Stegostoma tigrinum]|uniref:mitogen-activated protein kinase 15 n=1 Tax=Stegostoma tigrinum TaxID=3053191 RepID=UPI0028704072|nr:mitogen-activated protein kinase 15 [Stegostoma tigrinum]
MSGSEVDDHINRKYQLKRRLGKGAYGIVWKAIDRQTGEVVAVKKIFDAFRNQTDAQRTFREILFLQEFGNHPNIIKLLNVIRAANDKDIYLVFEYMETDLHAVIKKGNLLKDIHIRYILYQLLKATKFIHSGNVIHRDQKPSNILLDADCFVKLCDFGLARCINQIQEEQGNAALTEYVATRWYRAPEILLASPRYTKGVDMWSIGCILGEMLLGKPLFPGTSSINQIERIMSVIPAPSKEDILSINSDYGASVVQKVLSRPRSSIDQLLPSTTPPDALDLLNKLLVFNPDCRLTAEESLSHPYVNRFHNPLKEPRLDCDIILPVNDDTQLSVGEYRNKLYEMILERKINVRLQKRFLKGLEPVKPPPDPEQKEPMPASPKTIGISTTEGSIQPVLHGDRVVNNPIVNHSSYNPITHNTVSYASSHSDVTKKKQLCIPTVFHQTHGYPVNRVNENPDAQELCSTQQQSVDAQLITPGLPNSEPHGIKSAPVGRSRPASHYHRTAINNILTRKEAGHRGLGMTVSCAPLNPRPQSQARESRPNKKMFQMMSNMEAAGNPKAAWGSYCQTYGVISQTGLENLRHLQIQNKP